MNQDHVDDEARRHAIEQALRAGAGVVIVWAAGMPATAAAAAKLTKEAVKYTDAGTDEGKDCDDCSQFVLGKTAKSLGTCKLVEGPINPHGHCIAFSPKPKS